MAFAKFVELPPELRLMVWDHHARIPYDHHLIIDIGRTGNYTPPQSKREIDASFKWIYHLNRPSWPLPLLHVNAEARAVALAANPDCIHIQQPGQPIGGGFIYFNADQNILHFDYSTLHALESANRDNFRPPPPGDFFRATLHGFENIRNISIPVSGNFTLLKYLRQSAFAVFGSTAPPILRGVTYVEHLPGHPGTASTCAAYVEKVEMEVIEYKVNSSRTTRLQSLIIAREETSEIGQGRIWHMNAPGAAAAVATFGGQLPIKKTMAPNITWAASAALNPADKGQGQRAPPQ